MPERAKKKIFFSPIFFSLALLLLMIFIAWPLSRNFLKKNQVDYEISELQEEIARLEDDNTDLKKLLSYLESDQFVEAQARLNFGLKKPGEEVVVIKSGDSLNALSVRTEEYETLSNPIKWLKYFLKIKQ